MPHFHCKHCGIVTDDPEIIPLPEKDAAYRKLQARYDGFWQKVRDSEYGQFTIIAYNNLFIELGGKHNHFITCPVCENETTFWRESPWPVATLTREDGRPLPLSVRAMLEELENAKAEE